jgi:hypothetical protein
VLVLHLSIVDKIRDVYMVRAVILKVSILLATPRSIVLWCGVYAAATVRRWRLLFMTYVTEVAESTLEELRVSANAWRRLFHLDNLLRQVNLASRELVVYMRNNAKPITHSRSSAHEIMVIHTRKLHIELCLRIIVKIPFLKCATFPMLCY